MDQRQGNRPRTNILTITVEDYFQVGTFSHLIPFSHWERFDARLKRNTELTLALLGRSRARATFFASGWIGDNYPEILRLIVDEGHELACQGYYQQSIREISPAAFRDDLRRSKNSIEQATGRSVHGFRVGRGRIGPDDLWALDILAEEGFAYDASLAPIGRQFSNETERFILHRYSSRFGCLWEVPTSAASRFGWAIPFSGGNYLRQFPPWLIREAAAQWVERREAPLVMYFHIWELDTNQPLIHAASWLQRLRHYRNLAAMSERIEYFLNRYAFTSINDYLDLTDAPVADKTTALGDEPLNPLEAEDAVNTNARKITIVVPCYNEEASIAYLNGTLDRFVQKAQGTLNARFVFVDDGSTDRTINKLKSRFGERADCKIVRHKHNQGIAAAIITGFQHADSELLAVVDADCTFDPHQLLEMVPKLQGQIKVVAASPLHAGGHVANVPAWRLALSCGAAALYRCVLHHQFTSYTSCFRVYHRSVVSNMRVHHKGFCGVAEILARIDLAGHRMLECPAELETRILGQSKINLLKTIFDHLSLVARIAAARWLYIPLPKGNRADSDVCT